MDTNAVNPLELSPTSATANLQVVGRVAKDEPVALPTVDELMERSHALGVELRTLILLVKKVAKNTPMLEPHQDPTRSLGIAQSNMQAGFMWLRRAIKPTDDF